MVGGPAGTGPAATRCRAAGHDAVFDVFLDALVVALVADIDPVLDDRKRHDAAALGHELFDQIGHVEGAPFGDLAVQVGVEQVDPALTKKVWTSFSTSFLTSLPSVATTPMARSDKCFLSQA